jgi:hypothetical protein
MIAESLHFYRPPMAKPRLVINRKRRRVRFDPPRSAMPMVRAYLAERYGIALAAGRGT